jgi:hypothetical protein
MDTNKMSHLAVGAYGEKMVEAALLRRGWIPSNVNDSVKNAANFDIVAQGPQQQLVPIRVKTCRPRLNAFRFGYDTMQPIPTHDLRPVDFTVLVAMGKEMAADRFYVVPTQEVREALESGRVEFLKRKRKDGQPLSTNVALRLCLDAMASGVDLDGRYDFARKWEHFEARGICSKSELYVGYRISMFEAMRVTAGTFPLSGDRIQGSRTTTTVGCARLMGVASAPRSWCYDRHDINAAITSHG